MQTPSDASHTTMEAQRSDRVKMMAELADLRQQEESVKAQRLIDEFVHQAMKSGPAPVRLSAIIGGRVVKTNLRGWYLRRDHTIAIGSDGGYYRLGLPGRPSLMDLLKGVRLEPSAPPLVVGRGGKDGESGDLDVFLARALSGGVG